MSDPTGASNGSQYVPGFQANLNLLPQQTRSRLLPTIDSDLGYAGKGQFFNADDIGTSDPEDVTSRAAASPGGFLDMYRRFGTFKPYADGKFVDNEDLLRELEDPTSRVMQAMLAGQGRKRDNAIVTAAFGAYMYQDQNQNYLVGPTLAGFNNGSQHIPNNDASAHQGETLTARGGGGYGLTIGKLLDAKKLLDNSEIDEPEAGDKPTNYYAAVTAQQVQDLLETVPVTSNFYSQVQALASGALSSFMGFNFVRMAANATANYLPKAGYTRACLFFHRRALMYRARPVINAQIDRRADKSFRWYCYYEQDHGAVRRYDTGVVQVDCDELNQNATN